MNLKRINLQAASGGLDLGFPGLEEAGGSQALGATVAGAAGGGCSVLSGTVISPVGSHIIGIICSPGLFPDKLIPRQGKAV